MSNNWAQIFQNPKGLALKKFMAQIIDRKVQDYDDLLDRLGASLVTENDVKLFGNLMNDVMAAGYYKAVNNAKEKNQEKLG
jgi:hypothetical protein